MDIKSFIETTGIKAKEIRFLKPPGYPYIVFFDELICRGSDDLRKLITEHTVSLELYSKEINQDKSSDKIEKLILDELEVEFKRSREWIEDEAHYLTTYDFKFIEKRRR